MEDLDDLRDELDDLDYDEDEIQGVEVWLDGAADWEALAFLPGGVVLASENQSTMEDVLWRMSYGGASVSRPRSTTR